MNVITMHGRLARDAESFSVKTGNVEGTMVSFILTDFGLPNQKGEPMSIEVHFMKDVALSILPNLVKGKEVIVNGFLAEKNYVTKAGEAKSKKYISASIVQFVGKPLEKEGEDE